MRVEIKCKGSTTTRLGDLKPSQGNLKGLSDKNYKKLKDKILELGFSAPFFVWSSICGAEQKNKILLDGHQRLVTLSRMKKEGITLPDQFPCVEIDASDKIAAMKKVLAFSSNFGTMTTQGLKDFMSEIDFGMDALTDAFTFDAINFEKMNNEFFNEPEFSPLDPEKLNDVPELWQNAVSKVGDLWSLGEHKLLCGDSTKFEDVKKLMKEKKAQLIIIDPPYNINYEGRSEKKLTIKNDSMKAKDFYDFLHAAYTNLFTVADDGCGIYVFHSDTEGLNFRKAMVNAKWKLAQCCVWVKDNSTFGREDYHWQHEPILFGWKPTGAHRWYGDRKQTTVWNFKRPMKNSEHPTAKPVDLICHPMKISSQQEDLVVDFFLGAGTTLIAAEKLNRKCFGMEIDPRYCDVIIKRWQDLTGKEAVLEKTGKTYDETRSER